MTEGKTEIDIEAHFKTTRRDKQMDVLKELEGKRTYIVAAALALWAILGIILQKMTVEQGVTVLLEAGALIGIRASLQDTVNKIQKQ